MHFAVLVISKGPDDIEDLLAPYDEQGDSPEKGRWDYWRIGGRWSGALMVAPHVIPRLIEPCWEFADRNKAPRMLMDYGPEHMEDDWPGHNALATGQAQKCDIDFEAMGMRVVAERGAQWDEMQERADQELSRHEYIEEYLRFSAYACVTPDGEWYEADHPDWLLFKTDREQFRCEQEELRRRWATDFKRLVDAAPPDAWFTIVDAHA